MRPESRKVTLGRLCGVWALLTILYGLVMLAWSTTVKLQGIYGGPSVTFETSWYRVMERFIPPQSVQMIIVGTGLTALFIWIATRSAPKEE